MEFTAKRRKFNQGERHEIYKRLYETFEYRGTANYTCWKLWAELGCEVHDFTEGSILIIHDQFPEWDKVFNDYKRLHGWNYEDGPRKLLLSNCIELSKPK